MNVGVREFKAHLSDYLRRAAAGESVVVTDHGRPIVQLAPFAQQNNVDRGIAEGWIEAPRRTVLQPLTPVRSSRSTTEVLDEDRG